MNVLVTGVPGVGKTSVCTFLARSQPQNYRHVRFGNLILAALASPTGVTERALRQYPSSLVTPEVIARATEELLTMALASDANVLLIDSHAVSQDDFGFVVTPDGPGFFERFRYSAIIQLSASPEVVLSRSDLEVSGRRARSTTDLKLHAMLQSAVSVQYAANCSCPLYVVDSQAELSVVANRVDLLVKRVSNL